MHTHADGTRHHDHHDHDAHEAHDAPAPVVHSVVNHTVRGGPPVLDLRFDATNLLLDTPLYGVLPTAAQVGWDLVRPNGTVDAQVAVRGIAGDSATTAPATTQPADSKLVYEVAIQPRKLAVTPTAFPCTFSDVTGRIRITADAVELSELIGRRGESRVVLGGGADLKSGVWDLTIGADRVNIDDELIAALPSTLGASLTR